MNYDFSDANSVVLYNLKCNYCNQTSPMYFGDIRPVKDNILTLLVDAVTSSRQNYERGGVFQWTCKLDGCGMENVANGIIEEEDFDDKDFFDLQMDSFFQIEETQINNSNLNDFLPPSHTNIRNRRQRCHCSRNCFPRFDCARNTFSLITSLLSIVNCVQYCCCCCPRLQEYVVDT